MSDGVSHPIRRRAAGFTMVELLAATALMSLLMLAVLQVTASLGRARTLMQARQGTTRQAISGAGAGALPGAGAGAVWQLDVAACLERDLAQAGYVQLEEDDTLRLEGPLAMGLTARGHDHLPAIVRYRLVDAGGQKLLVREQRDVLDRTRGQGSRGLVAMHVERFEVELIQTARADDGEEDSREAATDERTEADVPLLAVHVAVHFAEDRHPPVMVRVTRSWAPQDAAEEE